MAEYNKFPRLQELLASRQSSVSYLNASTITNSKRNDFENKVIKTDSKANLKQEIKEVRLLDLLANAELRLQQNNIRTTNERSIANDRKAYQTAPDLASQFTSRFGLKSPYDVISFLRSPAGHSVKAKISEELAELDSLQKYRDEVRRQEALRKSLRLAFLLLLFVKKKEAKAEHLNEFIQKQIDERLKEQRQILTKNAQASKSNLSPVEKQIESLKEALDINEKEMATMAKEFENMYEKYQQRNQEIKNNQHAFDTHMDKVEANLLTILNGKSAHELKNEPKESRKAAIDRLETKKENVMNGLNDLMNEATWLSRISDFFDLQAIDSLSLLNPQQRNAQLTELNSYINQLKHLNPDAIKDLKLDKKIDNLATLKKHIHKKELFSKLMSQNFERTQQLSGELGHYDDLQKVIQNEKVFCNRYGAEVPSNQAEFIFPFAMAKKLLDNKKRLEKGPDGKYYLLKADQELDNPNNPLSEAEKLQALDEAEKLSPRDHVLVRKSKENYAKFEFRVNQEDWDIKEADMQSRMLEKSVERQEVTNELVSAQAKLANARTALEQTSTPSFQPTVSGSSKQTSKANNSIAQLHGVLEQIETIKVTKELLLELQLGFKDDHKMAQKLENLKPGDHMSPDFVKNIMRTPNVPEVIMNSLLKYIEQFGVKAEGPDKAMKSPFSLRMTPSKYYG